MIIEELIMKFLQNSWVVFITTTFTIIGIPLSIYLYFKSKKEKSLIVEMKSNNIFKNFESIIKNIKITCEDKNISTLTITRILIWCDGEKTIYDTDIATQMPLLIKSKGKNDILEAKIILSNNSANNVYLEKIEDNLYKINFEFLDNKDGFIIQIIHTGNNSDDILINGKIKGINKTVEKICLENQKISIILDKIIENSVVNFIFSKIFPRLIFIVFPIMVFIMYLYHLIFKIENMNIATHIISFFYLFIFILGIKLSSFKRKVPKEFQDF